MPEDKPEQKPASPPPPTAGEKPAAAAPPKPAAPAKPAGPTPQPWESEMVAKFKRRFGSGVREASIYVGPVSYTHLTLPTIYSV